MSSLFKGFDERRCKRRIADQAGQQLAASSSVSLLQSPRALEASEGRRAIATALAAPSWISTGCVWQEERGNDGLGDVRATASQHLDRDQALAGRLGRRRQGPTPPATDFRVAQSPLSIQPAAVETRVESGGPDRSRPSANPFSIVKQSMSVLTISAHRALILRHRDPIISSSATSSGMPPADPDDRGGLRLQFLPAGRRWNARRRAE